MANEIRISFERAKYKVDEMLKWVRACEEFLIEHPNNEQMLDELDLAKSCYTWALQHPDWEDED